MSYNKTYEQAHYLVPKIELNLRYKRKTQTNEGGILE